MKGKIKVTDRVQWHDGMLLQPHYFQLMDRRIEELAAFHLQGLSQFYWGAQELEVDSAYLTTGIFRVNKLEAIMPDSLIISHDESCMPLECNLKDAEDKLTQGTQPVFLVINKYRSNAGNAQGDFARYVSRVESGVIDENTGDNAMEVPRLAPKMGLYIGQDVPGNLIALPIAKISLVDGNYSLEEYTPPTINLPLSSSLGQRCLKLVTILRRKVAFMIEQSKGMSSSTLGKEVKETLQRLIGLLPSIEAVLYKGRLHPYDLFAALAKVYGGILAIHPDALPPVFDFYDHSDLDRTFNKVLALTESKVEAIQDGYVIVPFVKEGRVFTLPVEEHWLGERLIMGVRGQAGVTREALEEWVRSAVIASKSQGKVAQDRRVLGAKRSFLNEDEALGLVPTKGLCLFQVYRDFDFINLSEPLVMFNMSDEEQKRPLEVVLFLPKEQEGQSSNHQKKQAS